MRNHNSSNGIRHLLASVLAVLALTGIAVSLPQTKAPNAGPRNFGKINDQYYRGSQPDAAELAQLKSIGVKTVIDLRRDSDKDEPGQVRALGMQYFNIPLKSSQPATAAQTEYFLKLANDPANWPVYVHCKGGRHRTGALTAIYRITHDGWTADRAYEEMKEYDFNHGLFGGPSAQKKFVFSFYEQHATRVGQN